MLKCMSHWNVRSLHLVHISTISEISSIFLHYYIFKKFKESGKKNIVVCSFGPHFQHRCNVVCEHEMILSWILTLRPSIFM